MYSLGLDFGTESARALIVDIDTGEELGVAVHRYADGVIDRALPDGTTLSADWALQNPANYIESLRVAVPEAMHLAGARADDIVGIGVDFTACTLLPTRADGTPLSMLDQWRSEPHAWTKLWKHHAAHHQAERITSVASERGEPWLARYGGRISSEWLHSKVLQVLEESPAIYDTAERFIEAGDWLVWRMTGVELRNATAAGYKGLWIKSDGYPDASFLRALDPRLGQLNETHLAAALAPAGTRAGGLTEEAAQWMGLRPGTSVSVATIDAHAAVPGAGVTTPGAMVLIMGTSTCHMLVGDRMQLVPGISGVAEDGIIPNFFGYEAGQAGVGDIFEWFVEHATPMEYHQRSLQSGRSVYDLLQEDAAKLRPGESGLLALDWWNGNRSVLTDAGLSGVLIGATLGTRAHEIYRALIEATAFGTRIIIEAFEEHDIAVEQLIACGGLAERNKLMLQIYADVTGREFREAGSAHASALGAAMFGAVAAGSANGGYDTITEAAQHMSSFKETIYRPDPEHRTIHNQLFDEYRTLHDYFGRGGNDVMKRLRGIRREV